MRSVVAALITSLVGVGCIGEDLGEKGTNEEGLLVDGPPPAPWTRVSGNPNVKETYVVSAGDLQETGSGQNVLVGWIDLYTDTYSFGNNSGPMAVFWYWKRTRGVYPDGSCTVPNPRYDHTLIEVDTGCPPVPFGEHNHWNACPVHVMAGYGEDAPERLFGTWSATSTAVGFSWNVNGVKKKDYWFIKKKLPRIHYLELDGSRSNGPDSDHPSERTHGFAVGSNKQFNESVPLSTAMATHNDLDHTFHERQYLWDEGQATTRNGTEVAQTACNGREDELWWSFSCYENPCGDSADHPHTQRCIDRSRAEGKTFSELLRYWADPWPTSSNRKNAHWEWHSCHTPSRAESCYHGGSHAYPMLQAIDDLGEFYGWVGIEHQDDRTGGDDTDDLMVIRYLRTDLLP
jgi:hypothetical protein